MLTLTLSYYLSSVYEGMFMCLISKCTNLNFNVLVLIFVKWVN